jgi:hypothetical protein
MANQIIASGGLKIRDLNGFLFATNGVVTAENIPVSGLVPYVGATTNVDLGSNNITANSFIKAGGTSSQFLKADGSVDSTTYLSTISGIAAGGELEGTYPNPTLSNNAVINKVLTGLNLTGGGTIVATDSILQAFGKIQNQISNLISGIDYRGVWNASTNIPALASGVGTKGYYYVVNVAGNTNIDGITDWKVGDWIIFNGTFWDKIDNTDAVSSVNGYTGAVNLVTGDIPEGGLTPNLWFTDARARTAISLTTTGTSGASTYDPLTGIFNIPNYSTGSGIRTTQSFTATEGQTTFTISGGYTAGQIDVYVNGARQNNSEYVATNGTTIVFGIGLVVGDIVDVVIYTVTSSLSNPMTLDTSGFGEDIEYNPITNLLTIDKYSWMDLARGYTVAPTLFTTTATAEVYEYIYTTSTFYRNIKTDGTEDAFYSDSALTIKLCDKKIIL